MSYRYEPDHSAIRSLDGAASEDQRSRENNHGVKINASVSTLTAHTYSQKWACQDGRRKNQNIFSGKKECF
jgi:hypothetical protein